MGWPPTTVALSFVIARRESFDVRGANMRRCLGHGHSHDRRPGEPLAFSADFEHPISIAPLAMTASILL